MLNIIDNHLFRYFLLLMQAKLGQFSYVTSGKSHLSHLPTVDLAFLLLFTGDCSFLFPNFYLLHYLLGQFLVVYPFLSHPKHL